MVTSRILFPAGFSVVLERFEQCVREGRALSDQDRDLPVAFGSEQRAIPQQGRR